MHIAIYLPRSHLSHRIETLAHNAAPWTRSLLKTEAKSSISCITKSYYCHYTYMAFFWKKGGSGTHFNVCLSTVLLSLIPLGHAADPDPMQDYCVALLGPNNVSPMNGYPCKSRALVTSEDFVFTGLRNAGDTTITGTNATITYALVQEYPGVNTLGISHVRLDFAAGGVIPPHTHPLATETIFVVQGTIYTGFVSHDNKLYAQTLQQGDVFVFPRATLHFQMNVGEGPAVAFNSFNAQFPGLLLAANQLFETNISTEVLAAAFGAEAGSINSITSSIPRFWG